MAQRVTRRPSFKHSTVPPLFSSLHIIKSSLKGLHFAPIKYEAERRGAEVAPTSSTSGISRGNGFLSWFSHWCLPIEISPNTMMMKKSRVGSQRKCGNRLDQCTGALVHHSAPYSVQLEDWCTGSTKQVRYTMPIVTMKGETALTVQGLGDVKGYRQFGQSPNFGYGSNCSIFAL